MNATVKKWLIAAAVLVLLGAVLFAGVMMTRDWDFTKLSTVTYVTNTYKPMGEFEKISIDVDTTAIEFALAQGEECRIVCYEAEKVKHTAAVENGTLVISTADTRKWYDHICISLGSPKLTVYLPQNAYASLGIDTDTGDIVIPKDFSFETVKIDGDTSDVDCFAAVSDVIAVELSTGDIYIDAVTAGQLELTTDTGRIEVNSVTVQKSVEIETDTGRVTLTDISCADLSAQSDTGNVTLKRVVATGSLWAESDTGDVRLEDSDAVALTIHTSTGDVTGTLRSEKVFIVETDTGRVDVPKTVTGGRCEITTDTGDIRIKIQK